MHSQTGTRGEKKIHGLTVNGRCVKCFFPGSKNPRYRPTGELYKYDTEIQGVSLKIDGEPA